MKWKDIGVKCKRRKKILLLKVYILYIQRCYKSFYSQFPFHFWRILFSSRFNSDSYLSSFTPSQLVFDPLYTQLLWCTFSQRARGFSCWQKKGKGGKILSGISKKRVKTTFLFFPLNRSIGRSVGGPVYRISMCFPIRPACVCTHFLRIFETGSIGFVPREWATGQSISERKTPSISRM